MSIYAEMNHTRKLMSDVSAQILVLCEDREANADEIKKLRAKYENLDNELAVQHSDARAEAKADEAYDRECDERGDYDE